MTRADRRCAWHGVAAPCPAAALGTTAAGPAAPRVCCASAPTRTTCRSRTARREGFENRIAELDRARSRRRRSTTPGGRSGAASSARRSTPARATWCWASPAGSNALVTTRPYYRSTYVFVSRAGSRPATLQSFDDPRLQQPEDRRAAGRRRRANTPPAHALAERGIVDNVVGFTLYGDYAQPNPPARIVDAVAKRRRRRRGRLGAARRLLRAASRPRRLPHPGRRPDATATLPIAFDDRDGGRARATTHCATRSTRS